MTREISEANEAYIPFSTLQTIYNKGDKLNNIIFTTKNLHTIERNEAFETEYRKVLRTNHRFDPTDESAMWIWNRFTNYLQSQNAMGILRTAIWVIGIFTLLSGIVGVSNIMLITVKNVPGNSVSVRHWSKTFLHPLADHCGKRDYHYAIRLYRYGGRHRGDGMDELCFR